MPFEETLDEGSEAQDLYTSSMNNANIRKSKMLDSLLYRMGLIKMLNTIGNKTGFSRFVLLLQGDQGAKREVESERYNVSANAKIGVWGVAMFLIMMYGIKFT